MTQQRSIDFGSTTEASKFKDSWRRMFAPSVFEGYDFTILSSMIPNATVELSSGAVIVPNGTIVTDNAAISIEVPLGAAAFDSTIIYQHVDQKILGGVAAELLLITGIVSTWPDSAIMGWVSYPGGSIPLADAHLTQAPKAKIDPLAIPASAEIETYLPPFPGLFTISTDANVTAETVYDAGLERLFFQVSSTVFAAGLESAVLLHQFTTRATEPAEISVSFDAPTTDFLTIEIFDTNGASITGSPSTTAGTGVPAEVVFEITDGVFDEGEIFVVKLTVTVDIASIAQLARIDVSYRQLPF